MRLTIEIGNPIEAQQFLRIFKTLNLENAQIVVDVDEKKDSTKDLLNTINKIEVMKGIKEGFLEFKKARKTGTPLQSLNNFLDEL